jgi:thiamine-monophosphate kinase
MALGEFEMIDRLLKPLAGPGALGLVDDAAVLDLPAGRQLVIAKDAMVEDVHFLAADPPGTVAQKLLRVNLSDLAAMGAEPLGYLTAFALTPRHDDAWLAAFVQGLAADQRRFGLSLLGGDTVRTPGPAMFSLTILGTVPSGAALRRSTARPGDVVCVSGSLGEGALGLRVLTGRLTLPEPTAGRLRQRYRVPEPRLALGVALRGRATAAMDVSDGLVADLGHIAESSGTAAVIESAVVPIARDLRDVPGALDAALTGGDDYELLFTLADPADAARLAAESGTPVSVIGRIEAGTGVRVLDRDGAERPLAARGWTHF